MSERDVAEVERWAETIVRKMMSPDSGCSGPCECEECREDFTSFIASEYRTALAAKEAEIARLNDVLRRAGWGQGEIDNSVAVIEQLEIEMKVAESTEQNTDKAIDTLTAENARLRAALERYADKKSWGHLLISEDSGGEYLSHYQREWLQDSHGYSLAQHALKEGEHGEG